MRTPFLTPLEEHDLAIQAQAGDVIARDRIIAGILPLIHRYAHQTLNANTAVDCEDLVQAAVAKIVAKFGLFDPERGIRVITYFHHLILQTMIRETHDNGIMRTTRTGSNNPEVKASKEHHAGPVRSLNVRTPESTDGEASLLDSLADTHESTPSDEAHRIALSASVDACIERLPERWRQLMRWRFIDGLTCADIGLRLNLTRERVRQMVKEAMRWTMQILLLDPVVKEYVIDQGCVKAAIPPRESPRSRHRAEPKPRKGYPPRHKRVRNAGVV